MTACGGSSGGQEPDAPQADSGDTTPPVITLNGDSPMLLDEGEPYVEPGATAEDDVDGLFLRAVEVTLPPSASVRLWRVPTPTSA